MAARTLRLSSEEAQKNRLRLVILKKRSRLEALVAKTELLKVQLEMVRQEYNARIGNLYLKDNQLDLEIIQYKHIIRLMQDGMSFEAAVEEISRRFAPEQEEMEREREELKEDAEVVEKREQADGLGEELKQLWKRLIMKFHPDLVQDPTEKERRETLLKGINKAYEEQDLARLQQFESEAAAPAPDEQTLGQLEDMLVELENDIIVQTKLYRELRSSEWFSWKVKLEKAKKRSLDIFAKMERSLLDDIVKKYAILNSLKSQVAQTEGLSNT